MSGRLLRLACTAAAAQVVLAPAVAPAPATAAPGPQRPVAELLTDLQRLYRQAEQATETYNATEVALKEQRARMGRLDRELAHARLTLEDSRVDAGRLARQQYQGATSIPAYLRVLLARDPQQALDEGQVLGQLAREHAKTVGRLTDSEKQRDELARKARKALDAQLDLAQRQRKQRDDVRARLGQVERLLASLNRDQLNALAGFEQNGIDAAQRQFMASGALGTDRAPSAQGDRAVRYAVDQLGKPYVWGATGPGAYDCSGLTSQAWIHAGTVIPRTSQEQWARLRHIPLRELRPGDLVIYFPEATHVALYLGRGMVVQAPRPGARVKVSPIAANPVLGAVRPDPGGEPLKGYVPPRLPQGSPKGSDQGYSSAAAPATAAR
ncbi:NlpC/P60 family protein [Streptomyces sp. NPDC086787]|uniref:C40 family peptidase n=1 Tax=Streptomyces sp. NPDC086787 TaxID=3365759 RepID=UPI00381FBCD7